MTRRVGHYVYYDRYVARRYCLCKEQTWTQAQYIIDVPCLQAVGQNLGTTGLQAGHVHDKPAYVQVGHS
jgi:hypothetical protein